MTTPYIHHIETLVPEFCYAQTDICQGMKGWLSEKRTRRLLDQLYKRSGIETRYSVIPDMFAENAEGKHFGHATTSQRNDIYTSEAKKLAIKLGKNTFANCPDFTPADVTHVVFASCTGFCNPGPEFHMMRELGIPDSAERYTLGFMGCYAAFPALRMGSQFCQADEDAVVLVVCLELSSLHMQIGDSQDSLLGNSLFADGAGAAIVSARKPQKKRSIFGMLDFQTAVVPSGESDMAWSIGDHGFDLVLSSYVAKILGAEIKELVPNPNEFDTWAVHPGGRAILDKVSEALDLPEPAMNSSREILRQFGNMSSATILFVLKHLLETSEPGKYVTKAMAFGPGLTVETATLSMRTNAS